MDEVDEYITNEPIPVVEPVVPHAHIYIYREGAGQQYRHVALLDKDEGLVVESFLHNSIARLEHSKLHQAMLRASGGQDTSLASQIVVGVFEQYAVMKNDSKLLDLIRGIRRDGAEKVLKQLNKYL